MKRTLFFSACLTAISSIGLVSAVVQNRSIQEQPTLSAVADSTILPKEYLGLKSDFVKFMDLFGPSVDHFDFTKEAALSNLFPKDSIVLGNKLDRAHIDTWRKKLTYEQETLLHKFVDYSNGYFSVIRRMPTKMYPVKLIQGDNHYAFIYREVNSYSENQHYRDYIVVFDQNGVFVKSSWLGSVSLFSFISYSINNNLIATIQEHKITSNVQPKTHPLFHQAYQSSSAVEQITLGNFQTINLTEKEKVMYDDFFEGFPPIDSTGKLLDPHSLNHPENPLSKN
jgi:hypothetical protein